MVIFSIELSFDAAFGQSLLDMILKDDINNKGRKHRDDKAREKRSPVGLVHGRRSQLNQADRQSTVSF
jgi:hypothetical protein